ncbi:hypothetical protein [Thalassolituus marinus]|uniref:Uncharacterized protein n=1 Tax=Thalassolituus marinus TaxID=671053 RepID=A0ABS7ZUT9_9GAMM|nr:hypothetical protein [Thalassolituus marinus]MCA6064968.1 hypothetical protein [Thalassolituus marinus]
MNNQWSPINEPELTAMLADACQRMDTSSQALWQLIQLPKPELWQQHPWGDEGCGFWVLAVMGRQCIYYNDICQGFCRGHFSQWGLIDDYQQEQLSLSERLTQFLKQMQPLAEA